VARLGKDTTVNKAVCLHVNTSSLSRPPDRDRSRLLNDYDDDDDDDDDDCLVAC